MKYAFEITKLSLCTIFYFPFFKVKERVSDVEGEFADDRVVDLWEKAQRSGFKKEELESIKVWCQCGHSFFADSEYCFEEYRFLSCSLLVAIYVLLLLPCSVAFL